MNKHAKAALWAALLPAMGLLFTAAGQRGGRGVMMPDDQPAMPPHMTDVARAKADWTRNLQDATRLAELAVKVKHDLETANSYSLSLRTIKDTEEMAKLSKALHGRLKSSGVGPDPMASPYDATRTLPKQ